jgi:leucyl aminopeptidase
MMNLQTVNGFSPDLTTLVIPMFKQSSLNGWLSTLSEMLSIPEELLISDFQAEHKTIFTTFGNGQRIMLLGLGENIEAQPIIEAFRSFSNKTKGKNFQSIGVDFINFQFDNIETDLIPMFCEWAANGLALGQYDIGLLKTDKKAVEGIEKAEFLTDENIENDGQNALNKGLQIAETQMEVMTLLNLPSSHKNALIMADWAIESGKKYGYSVQVFEKAEIEKLGLHALLAVNRGSEIPPRFIVMEHKPKNGEVSKTVGLVGKGVTYDTGGLNIKTQGMHHMKSDMGGAAAVFGALEIAAKLDLPIHLIGIVPTTDNCVDANSIKPGDVIGSFSGLTIEVMDTDAEGRLILADGLNYLVKNYSPDVLIDLATLTGSSVRTLGYAAGALFTQNDDLARDLYESGLRTGEKLWRLPMWNEYKKNLKSDIADLRNYGLTPLFGASEAAKFLEHFIENHPAYAHLDIAGTAYIDSEYATHKSASAFGVRLLLDYLTK